MSDPWKVPGRGNNADAHSCMQQVQPGIEHSSSSLQAADVPLFCPDTAAEVRDPLVGAVLSLHPFPADELRHL